MNLFRIKPKKNWPDYVAICRSNQSTANRVVNTVFHVVTWFSILLSSMINQSIISVSNLSKRYQETLAVDNISFDVHKGEIFGLLGENGAGKTTTLEIIEGLRQASSGEIKVFGQDIKSSLPYIKEKIGVQLQSSAYFGFLSLFEILSLFSSFYQRKADPKRLLFSVRVIYD